MLILVNGPINSGKSTLARGLAAALPEAVHLEVDDLPRPPGMPIDQAVPFVREHASGVLAQLLAVHPVVVLSWIIGEEEHAEFGTVAQRLGHGLLVVTLAPRKEVALSNRGGGTLSDWERARIEHHYATGVANPPFGARLDNSDLPPEKTLEGVLELIERVRRLEGNV